MNSETATLEPVILVERHDSIAIVTLNRPASLNALSRGLSAAIGKTFRELQRDKTITAAILTGAGRAFCAGLDLKELADIGGLANVEVSDEVEMMQATRAFDRPIIGAINGAAITGGFELALMCDMLIASPNARFADTHARVGVIPGWHLSQALTRIVGINRARELSFTGNFLSAEKAEAWGIVNRVVAAEELLPTCLQLAKDMASCDQATLREYKKLINDGAMMSMGDAVQLERTTHLLTRRNATGDAIATRRENVFSRGRDQTTD